MPIHAVTQMAHSTLTTPEMILSYKDNEGRSFTFTLNLLDEASQIRLIRTAKWAALSGIRLKLTPTTVVHNENDG